MEMFNKVKSFRTGAGITQDQMADALGISRTAYVSKENGLVDWKLNEMKKFIEKVNESTGCEYSVKDIFF